MKGQLFELFGSVAVPSYFFLLFTAFLVATAVGVLWARRLGHHPDPIVDLAIGMALFGVVGARLLHVFADGYFWDYVHLCTDPSAVDWRVSRSECLSEAYRGVWDQARGLCHPTERDCFAWAAFWAGGLTYYGGFLGASLAAFFYLRRDRFPFWRAADMAGMVVPLGLALGRLGCFLAGCCFGAPHDGVGGMSFPPFSPASEAQAQLGLIAHRGLASLPVHATQLYESFGCWLLAGYLIFRVHPRKRFDGEVFLQFVAAYAVLRFLLEFLRADARGGVVGLSTSQWVGVGLLVAAVALHRIFTTKLRI